MANRRAGCLEMGPRNATAPTGRGVMAFYSGNADTRPLWVDVVEKVGHERVEALYWAFAQQF